MKFMSCQSRHRQSPTRPSRAACLVGLSLLVLRSFTSVTPAAQITHQNGKIVFAGTGFGVSFSDTNGSVLSVTTNGSAVTILTSGELGLWSASFQDGTAVNATVFNSGSIANSFRWTADGAAGLLTLKYTNSQLAVAINVSERTDGIDFSAQVQPARTNLLEFSLPGRLRFMPANLTRLVCPLNANEAVGAAFKPGFFVSQPETNPAAWQTRLVGPSGYISLFGAALTVRPDNDPPVPITITTNGRAWLGTNIANRWNGTNAVVNRPSTSSQVDLSLANSTNGTFFGASHLGGQGYLFRFGGAVSETLQPLALDLVVASIEHLALAPAPGRTNVGLISLKNGPASGGWAAVTVSQWRNRLQASSALAAAGLRVVEIPNAQELLNDLSTTNFLAILNPYGEWTPVLEQSGMTATLSKVGPYVRGGGNWFETGGYSFYYELRPVHYYTYSTPYPPAFADFVHFETVGGAASLFGVQPQTWAPWAGSNNPAALFIPGRLAWGADAQGGYWERAFETYVRPGQSWQTPAVRLVLSYSAPNALLTYCQANQFNRRLQDKMQPSVLDKFKQSVLVYYEGNCTNKLAYLDQLPSPCLVHFADYMLGGFDKEYPDHLPPNPAFGTPADFSLFFQRCAQLGLLVMPYSNPTWWCDHPRGPTFLAQGESPLLKRLDGSLSYEAYGANDGYTVCHWHPAVQAANRFTRQQFITNYPVDLLFEDQCGARTWQYDTNPASPTPYAYADGLISMVAEDSVVKPLSTENGWDRIINYESQLCGITWGIVPTEGAPSWRSFLNDRYSPATWDVFPVAQYIAHDKTSMVHHDLGQFVTDDEVLSWTLGLGYGLSYRISTSDLGQAPAREWLGWLDRLQKSVCARYVGQPVISFTQDRGTNLSVEPDGMLQATYGQLNIVANLGSNPHLRAGVELAPFGFYATAPGMIAAHLNSLSNSAPGQDKVSFVVEDKPGNTEFWVYSTGERPVSIQLPRNLDGTASVQLPLAAATNVPVQNGVVTVNLGYKPEQARILPPPELAGKAPIDWPTPKPAIGILNLPGMPRSWTSITPANWVQTFTTSPLATQFGVPIRQITTFSDLTNALYAGPSVWLAIINPGGEIFPTPAAGQWQTTLSAIQYYVNHGGSWWETAGYSFYVAAYLQSSTWQTEVIGPGGMNYFGVPVGSGDVAQAAEPLVVTAQGQTIFGPALSAQLQGLASAVNRSLPRTPDDPGHLTLLAGAQADFLGAYRLDGWGYLWRFGGFNPNPNVALPAAAATMEYLYTHLPLPFQSGPTRYLWHGNMIVQTRPVLKRAAAANGFFSFAIGNCATGATNYLQRASDPAGQSPWQDIFSFLSPSDETNWTDPALSPGSFYRVKSVPAAALGP
jgi:hypothetical protein